MGLFDIFKKDSNKKLEFLVPIEGTIIKVEDIPDQVFSQKMMGDGFGINPKGNRVFSPVSGEVVSIFPTKHAIGLKTPEGIEVLVHVGLDTVNLKGEGFTSHIATGDKVKAGDLLLEVDFENIKSKVPSIITPIIFTELNGYKFDVKYGDAHEKAGDVVTISKGE